MASMYYGNSVLKETMGLSDIAASTCLIPLVLGGAMGSAIVWAIADRYPNKKAVVTKISILYLCLWLCFCLLIRRFASGWILLILFFLGISSCGYTICYAIIKEQAPPEIATLSSGFANMGAYVGSTPVPLLTGLVIEHTNISVSNAVLLFIVSYSYSGRNKQYDKAVSRT